MILMDVARFVTCGGCRRVEPAMIDGESLELGLYYGGVWLGLFSTAISKSLPIGLPKH
jgi:hypothetical protein